MRPEDKGSNPSYPTEHQRRRTTIGNAADRVALTNQQEDQLNTFVMAEHRAAYASWCGKQGLKQCDAVYVSGPERLADRTIAPDQFVFVDGWEKNARHTELMAAYGHATLRHWEANK